MILLLEILLSFCSTVYMLLLAQALVAFRQDAVLCYSLAFGFFFFATAWGALWAERRLENPFRYLWLALMGMALAGASGLGGLFLIEHGRLWSSVLWGWGCLTIFAVGVLKGATQPWIRKISEEKKGPSGDAVRGAGQAGYVLGSLAFVFLFYPYAGIVQTLFLIVAINVLCGVAALRLMVHAGRALRLARMFQIGLLLVAMYALIASSLFELGLIRFYLG